MTSFKNQKHKRRRPFALCWLLYICNDIFTIRGDRFCFNNLNNSRQPSLFRALNEKLPLLSGAAA